MPEMNNPGAVPMPVEARSLSAELFKLLDRDGSAGLGEAAFGAELKGSIGEGSNHSNHSNRSNSFKIGIFRNVSLENSKFSEIFNILSFSKLSAKFRQNTFLKFHQNLSKNQ